MPPCGASPGELERMTAPSIPPRRCLLIACHWLGDTFWASQVLPALQARWPDTELHVGAKPAALDLFRQYLPDERLLPLPEIVSDRRRERFHPLGFLRRAIAVRGMTFDLVIDLTGNRYSALFSRLVASGSTIGFDGGELGCLYTRRVPDAERPEAHLSERPWRVAQAVVPDLTIPPLPTPVAPGEELPGILASMGITDRRPYAVIAPGAGWATKRWPAPRFHELAAHLERQGLRVIACGSAAEQELCREVVRTLDHGGVADLSVGDLCTLVTGARVVIANDSAVAHLAAAAGLPVIVLFCPTNPLHCRPLGPRVTILRTDCPLRPEGSSDHCPHWTDNPCPRPEWMQISTDTVIAAVMAQLPE